MTDSPFNDAAAAEQAWGRILSDVAHDLRGVAGGADLWIGLLESGTEPVDRAKAFDQLRRAVERTVRMAEDLGDLAACLGQAPGDPALPFDLPTLVERVCRGREPDAATRGVSLRCRVTPGFAHALVGDEVAWGRALDRLLGAGLAQARRGSSMTLRLAAAGDGAEVSVPWGVLEIPPAGSPLAAWGAPRSAGETFPLGPALARAFLERAGARLEVRPGDDERLLVAVIP